MSVTYSLQENSFLSAQPTLADCIANASFCYPLFEDGDLNFPLVAVTADEDIATEQNINLKIRDCDGEVIHDSNGSTNWKLVKAQDITHQVCGLAVTMESSNIELLLSRLRRLYPECAPWFVDPLHTNHIYNNDSGGACDLTTIVSLDGVSFTTDSSNLCHLIFAVPVDDAIIAYLNTTYPTLGPWERWMGTNNKVVAWGGDLSGFTDGTLPSFTFLCGITKYLDISSYTYQDSDITDYLNDHYPQYGPWSKKGGKYVASSEFDLGDISIPGAGSINFGCEDITTTYKTYVYYYAPYLGWLDDAECAQSVSMQITINSDTTQILYPGCFVKVCNPCFTRRVRYTNNDNAFGFYYYDVNGTAVPNANHIIRLNIYLQNPQIKSADQVYRKATGEYVTLSSIMEEEFDMIIDRMNAKQHRCLTVGLKHDSFQVFSDETNTYETYNNQGQDYAIDWQNKPGINLPDATAKTKLKLSPFYNVNSNCR